MGDNINNTFLTTVREAYHSFLHGKKKKNYKKEKSSLYSILNKNKNIFQFE